MMATDCSSRSKEVCQICGQETSSRCLHCSKPVCSRSKSCYIATSEEEPGWKPGHTVSICTLCTNSKLKPCIKEHSATKKGSNATRQRRNKGALKIPKRSANVLTFQRKLKSLSLQSKTLTFDQGN